MAKFDLMIAMGAYGTLITHIDFDFLNVTSSTGTKAVFTDYIGATITFKGKGFTYDEGVATAGKVTDVEFRNSSGELILDVTDGKFALKKMWDADYSTMLSVLQSGNDTMTGTDLADNLLAGSNAGHDKIMGGNGDDFILGSAGDNQIDGGRGRDVLTYEMAFVDGKTGIKLDAVAGEVTNAWGGTDKISRVEIFFATDMKDVMKGSKADEVFDGKGGNDRVTGGAGDDRFHFFDFAGQDTITDFGHGNDLIHIRYGVIDAFSDLSIEYKKGDAIITLDPNTVLTLLNVDEGELFARDFTFGID